MGDQLLMGCVFLRGVLFLVVSVMR
jgi:hypothetical protein